MKLPGRRNGAAKEPGRDLILVAQRSSEGEDDGWAETTPVGEGSGYWIVFKVASNVPQGGRPHYGIQEAIYTEGATGVEAIKVLYDKLYDIANESKADGRYVALDYYGGERVEALVSGEWRVDIAVAPRALAP